MVKFYVDDVHDQSEAQKNSKGSKVFLQLTAKEIRKWLEKKPVFAQGYEANYVKIVGKITLEDLTILFTHFPFASRLWELDLSNCRWSNKIHFKGKVDVAEPFNALKRLKLRGTAIDTNDLEALINKFPFLKELDISHCNFLFGETRANLKLPYLETLIASGTVHRPTIDDLVKKAPKLKVCMDYRNSLESPEGQILYLANLEESVAIKLTANPQTTSLRAILSHAEKVKTLDLSNCKLPKGFTQDEAINFVNLETLDVSASTISMDDLEALLTNAPHLKKLTLSYCPHLHGTFKTLVELSELETVVADGLTHAVTINDLLEKAPDATLKEIPLDSPNEDPELEIPETLSSLSDANLWNSLPFAELNSDTPDNATNLEEEQNTPKESSGKPSITNYFSTLKNSISERFLKTRMPPNSVQSAIEAPSDAHARLQRNNSTWYISLNDYQGTTNSTVDDPATHPESTRARTTPEIMRLPLVENPKIEAEVDTEQTSTLNQPASPNHYEHKTGHSSKRSLRIGTSNFYDIEEGSDPSLKVSGVKRSKTWNLLAWLGTLPKPFRKTRQLSNVNESITNEAATTTGADFQSAENPSHDPRNAATTSNSPEDQITISTESTRHFIKKETNLTDNPVDQYPYQEAIADLEDKSERISKKGLYTNFLKTINTGFTRVKRWGPQLYTSYLLPRLLRNQRRGDEIPLLDDVSLSSEFESSYKEPATNETTANRGTDTLVTENVSHDPLNAATTSNSPGDQTELSAEPTRPFIEEEPNIENNPVNQHPSRETISDPEDKRTGFDRKRVHANFLETISTGLTKMRRWGSQFYTPPLPRVLKSEPDEDEIPLLNAWEEEQDDLSLSAASEHINSETVLAIAEGHTAFPSTNMIVNGLNLNSYLSIPIGQKTTNEIPTSNFYDQDEIAPEIELPISVESSPTVSQNTDNTNSAHTSHLQDQTSQHPSRPSRYFKALKKEASDSFRQLEELSRSMAKTISQFNQVETTWLLNPAKTSNPKQNAYKLFRSMERLLLGCKAILSQLRELQGNYQNQLDHLSTFKSTKPKRIAALRASLEKKIARIESKLNDFSSLEERLEGNVTNNSAQDKGNSRGFLAIIQQFVEGKGALELLGFEIKAMDYEEEVKEEHLKKTYEDYVRPTPEPVNVSFHNKKAPNYLVAEPFKEGHFREYAISLNSSETHSTKDGVFIEERSGKTDSYTNPVPAIKFTVTKFPGEGTTGRAYAMAIASQLLLNGGFPTKRSPCRLKGANRDELRYLYASLTLLLQKAGKYDKNAIKIVSTHYDPTTDKELHSLLNQFRTCEHVKPYLRAHKETNKSKKEASQLIHNFEKAEQKTNKKLGFFQSGVTKNLENINGFSNETSKKIL